jgi:hypothetical protein
MSDWHGYFWQSGRWHRVTGPHPSLSACSRALTLIGKARGVPDSHQGMTTGDVPRWRPAGGPTVQPT